MKSLFNKGQRVRIKLGNMITQGTIMNMREDFKRFVWFSVDTHLGIWATTNVYPINLIRLNEEDESD